MIPKFWSKRLLLFVCFLSTVLCVWWIAISFEQTVGDTKEAAPIVQKNTPPKAMLHELLQRRSHSPPQEASAQDTHALDAFEDWLEEFADAAPNVRSELIQRGMLLAQQRWEPMKRLIVADPETAFGYAVSYEIRRELPEEIRSNLETPLSAFANYELLVSCPPPGEEGGGTKRIALLDNQVFQVHTFGDRINVTSKDQLSLHGFALDNLVLMSDNPIHVLSNIERKDRDISAPLAVAVGQQVFGIESEKKLEELRRLLKNEEFRIGPQSSPELLAMQQGQLDGIVILDDGGFIPPEEFELPELQSDHTEGPKTMLYIRARFSNQDANYEPNDLATVQSRQAACEAYWFENSYGKSSLTTTFTDVITLPNSASFYADLTSGRLNRLFTDALPLVEAAGEAKGQDWDEANYDFYTMLTTGGSWGYAGVASVGGRRSHLNGAGSSNVRTASHEFGHNLGLRHANYWRTDSTSPIGRDSFPGGYVGDDVGDERIEYGHKFSVMSAQNGGGDFNEGRGHYTTGEKVRLDWLVADDGDWVSIDQSISTPIRLYRQDVESEFFDSMTPGVIRAIKINRDSGDYADTNKRRYWLSYRVLPTNGVSEDWLPYGLQVDWQREIYGGDGSILLDMTPFSNDDTNDNPNARRDNGDKEDAVLVVGRTYSDEVADIHFTPIGRGGDNPNEWLDVIVNIGTQEANTAPQITSFEAGATQVDENTPVNFEVNAVDDDGDILYYSWTFGDNSLLPESLNAPAVAKLWIDDGFFPVRVTVSDGKGGSDSREVIVRVGTSTQAPTIAGRVIHAGLPVQGARVYTNHNVQAWTDGTGRYVLPAISDEINVVTASKAGLTLEPLFSNPVVITDSAVPGRDWVALENGKGTGSLELVVTPFETTVPLGIETPFTALAWDANGIPLDVNPSWSVQGSGSIDASGLYTATNTGGPFEISAQVDSIEANAFVEVLNIEAVGVVTLTPEVGESAGEDMVFRFRRYGPTSSDLDLFINYDGSSVWAEDYEAFDSSIRIPAGKSFEDLVLEVYNDAIDEDTENLTISIGRDSRYTVYSAEASATVNILDDADTAPVITVTSPASRLAMVPAGVGLLIETDIEDDGFPDPPGVSNITWSIHDAPPGGSVVFSPPKGTSTVAYFGAPGSYTLLMTADDGVNRSTATLTVVAGLTQGATPGEAGEIVYYPLDEGSGLIAEDVRGGDNNGALVDGVSWTLEDEAVSGTAVRLDGITGQINIPDSNEINLQDYSARTIALWFKSEDPLKPGKQVLYEEGGNIRGLNIYLYDGLLYVGGWNNGGNGWENTYLSTPLTDTDWHQVTLVLDAQLSNDLQENAFRGYLDGVEFSIGDAAPLDSHSGDIALGANRDTTRFHDGVAGSGGSNSTHFTGLIDEFHLWNRVLTQGEIGLLFSRGYLGPVLSIQSPEHSTTSVVVPEGMGLVLEGMIEDENLLGAQWETIQAPPNAVAQFFDPFSPQTSVQFSAPGFYKLRLSATDGIQKSALDVNVHVGLNEGGDPAIERKSTHLKMDTGSGILLVDTGYAEAESYLEGAEWSDADEGIEGFAAAFSGGNSFISFRPPTQVEESDTQKSYSLWFWPSVEVPSHKEVVFEVGGEREGMNIYLEGTVLYFHAWEDGARRTWNSLIPVPIERDRWHHAVLIRDVPDSNQIYLDGTKAYLNGVLVGVGPGYYYSGGGDPGLGGVKQSTLFHDGLGLENQPFSLNGLVDDFRYYHAYALSPNEVGQLYAHGNIGPVVDAGADMPDVAELSFSVNGSAIDDGRWNETLSYKWGFLDRLGAGTVNLPDSSVAEADVELIAGGSYRLYLGANDGQLTTYDEKTVTIDQPGFFELYMNEFTNLPIEDRTATSNPDQDERTNLEEYGYGGNPESPETVYEYRLLPKTIWDNGQRFVEFVYPRRKDAALRGLLYEFEISSKLEPESWFIPLYEIRNITPIDDTFEEVRIRLLQPIQPEDRKQFGRLRLQLLD